MKVGFDGVLLGAWVNAEGARTLLDVGTGTGVIAIMLAQRNQEAEVYGIDLDPDSARQAGENMKACPWSARLHAIQEAVQDHSRSAGRQYDLIVSNPPFFSGGTFSDKVERNQVRHTIKLPHGDLLRAVQKLLAPDGRFGLILPVIEGLRFRELAENYQFYCIRKCEVRSRPSKPAERLLMEFKRTSEPLQKEQLYIQEDKGKDKWSEAYRELCQDFYLHF